MKPEDICKIYGNACKGVEEFKMALEEACRQLYWHTNGRKLAQCKPEFFVEWARKEMRNNVRNKQR